MTLRACTESGAVCALCRTPIALGQIHIEYEEPIGRRERRRTLLHPRCEADLSPENLSWALQDFVEPFDDRDALTDLARARLRSPQEQADRRWSCTIRSAPGDERRWLELVEPPSNKEPAPIEPPAATPDGRPRVRVLLAGSAVSLDRAAGRALAALLHVRAWPSPKREYHFVPHSNELWFDDRQPWLPLLGAVYAPIATKGAVAVSERVMGLASAFGLRPPILWLIGVSSSAPRDAHVLRFRSWITDCGFDGDACPVLCAPKITEAALDRLALALDEHLELRSHALAAHPWGELSSALLRAVREGDAPRCRVLVPALSEPLRGLRDERINRAMRECAAMLIARGDLRLSATLLQARVVLDVETFRAWFALATTKGDLEDLRAISGVCVALRSVSDDSVVMTLLEALPDTLSEDAMVEINSIVYVQSTTAELAAVERWCRAHPAHPLANRLLASVDDRRARRSSR